MSVFYKIRFLAYSNIQNSIIIHLAKLDSINHSSTPVTLCNIYMSVAKRALVIFLLSVKRPDRSLWSHDSNWASVMTIVSLPEISRQVTKKIYRTIQMNLITHTNNE